MEMKRLILIPTGVVLFIVLAYAGFRGYVYYSIKGGLDDFVTAVSPFAQVKYESLGIDLGGAIAVNKISVTPRMLPVDVSVDKVTLRGPDFGFLMDLSGGFKDAEIPEFVTVNLRRVRIPDIEAALQQAFTVDGTTASSKVAECSLPWVIRRLDLAKLGYEDLMIDLEMGLQKKPGGDGVIVKSSYAIDDMESSRIEADVTNLPSRRRFDPENPPTINFVDLIYTLDPKYVKAVTGYCAGQQSTTVDRFLTQLFNQPPYEYKAAMGFIPGDGIRDALRELWSKGGTIKLSISPPPDFNPADVSLYRPEDVPQVFGMTLAINDRQVTDLRIIDPESAGPTAEGESALATRELVKYVRVGFSDLPKHIGTSVRIYTSGSDIPKEGILLSVKNRIINVEQRVRGGKYAAHIEFADFRRAEVLQVVDVPLNQ